MSLAVVLGGADCVADDFARFTQEFGWPDRVVACNDAIGEFEAATVGVTLHPEELHRWTARREAQGFPEIPLYTQRTAPGFDPPRVTLTVYHFPDQPEAVTSAVMAAKVAMIDLGCRRVVFCGVPMTKTPHFVPREDVPVWDAADHYFKRWRTMILPEFRACMRSMSGRTRDLLGHPDQEFCRG